jgi:hypothetical protein
VLDEVGVQGRNLLLGDVDLLQGGRDLLEGEKAALAAQRVQPTQLLGVLELLLPSLLVQPLRDRLQRLDLTASNEPNFPFPGEPARTLRLAEV